MHLFRTQLEVRSGTTGRKCTLTGGAHTGPHLQYLTSDIVGSVVPLDVVSFVEKPVHSLDPAALRLLGLDHSSMAME